MAAFSAYLQEAIANWAKGTPMPVAPGSLVLAISTADPLDDGSGLVEPVGNGYSRQAFTFGGLTTTNGVGTVFSNSGNIIFTASGGAWGAITHWAIFDDSANMLWHGAVAVSKNIQDGDSFVINDGTGILTLR